MARTASVSKLSRTVQMLRDEWQSLAARLLELDEFFAVLGGVVATEPEPGAGAGAAPGAVPAPRRGRPPGSGRTKSAGAKGAQAAPQRGTFPQTGAEFLLGLLAGKKLSTAEVNDAWQAAGRAGKADITLMNLVKAKKLKRRKIRGGRGSRYVAV